MPNKFMKKSQPKENNSAKENASPKQGGIMIHSPDLLKYVHARPLQSVTKIHEIITNYEHLYSPHCMSVHDRGDRNGSEKHITKMHSGNMRPGMVRLQSVEGINRESASTFRLEAR